MSSFWRYQFEVSPMTEEEIEDAYTLLSDEGYPIEDNGEADFQNGVLTMRGENQLYGTIRSELRHSNLTRLFPGKKFVSCWKSLEDEWDFTFEG